MKRTIALAALALATACADPYSNEVAPSGPSPADAMLMYGMMSRPTYQMRPFSMPAPAPMRPVMYQRTGPGMWMAF